MNTLKKNLKFIIVSVLVFIASLAICLFALPNVIPTLINVNEKIVSLGSKWLMLLSVIIPLVFSILAIAFSVKKQTLSNFFKYFYFLELYENMLLYIYLCLSENIFVGSLIEIPLTTFIFIPLSISTMLYGLKLKKTPYKSNLGLKFKSTLETEFIWKQTHFFARDAVFGFGTIMFLISIVFSFFRLWYIPLIIYILGLSITILIIWNYSNGIYKKYLDMKQRQETLNKK